MLLGFPFGEQVAVFDGVEIVDLVCAVQKWTSVSICLVGYGVDQM